VGDGVRRIAEQSNGNGGPVTDCGLPHDHFGHALTRASSGIPGERTSATSWGSVVIAPCKEVQLWSTEFHENKMPAHTLSRSY